MTTSQVDPKKLKSLLNKSQTELDEPEEEGQEDAGSDGADGADEADEGDEDEKEEHTVESMTDALKPAVDTLNEIVDEFRTGTDAQPKAGVEALEEAIDAETAHEMCEWATEAGKKDFRKLGEALDLEDVDGFVGWMRAVRKMEDEGEGEGKGDEEEEETEEEPGEEASGGEEETEESEAE